MAELLDLWNLTAQKIDGDLNNYSMNLFGEDGSGKSSLMYAIRSKLGSTAIFGFEDRFKGIPNVRVVEMEDWNQFNKYKAMIKKGIKQHGKLPFTNIIMDTVGEAYTMCQTQIMEENEWETMSGERGARYPVVGKAFLDAVRELKHMGFIVNFVSHDKNSVQEDANGNEYDKLVPDTANQIKHLVMGGIDIISYLERAVVISDDGTSEKEVRRLWLHGHPKFKLKTPLYGFPRYIEYETVDEGAEKFIAAFDKAVKITQDMADKGLDISNPNEDNDTIIEYVEPKTKTKVEVDDFDDLDSDPLPSSLGGLTIEDAKEKAIEIRDTMLGNMEKSEVVAILKATLGTASIAKCNDIDKLTKFIKDNE